MKPSLVLFLAFMYVLMEVGHAQLEPFLLDCGSDSVTKVDGRKWVGDSGSGNNYSLSSLGITASTSSANGDPAFKNIYQSARVFNTSARYNFPVLSKSFYCIRLHFYPFQFNSLNANDSIFDLTADNIKLVSKFNVSEEISWKNTIANMNTSSSYVVKEFFLNVTSNELVIEFVPGPGSFAFVNAMEIIPVSNNLFVDSAYKVGSFGTKTPLGVGDRGIETMYRLNVGGAELRSTEDNLLWRRWESDEKYMFTLNAATVIANSSNISYAFPDESFVAPLVIYETARIMANNELVEKRFNLSWRFVVDPNFDYLIRLHFCELICDKANQRDFRIYINNKTASEGYDIFMRANGMNRAYHEDYADVISQQADTLWVQLGPDSLISNSGTDALLNGLEIFKLSRNGNLAHSLGRAGAGGEGTKPKKHRSETLFTAIGVIAISLFSVSVASVFFFVCHRKKESLEKDQPPGWHPLFLHEAMGSTKNARAASKPAFTASNSMGSHRTGKMFNLAEIKAATRNFDDSLVIGNGGFGKVYKGEIEPGIPVAIKRANPMSQQGLAEFETEIEMLSKLRHRHLVSLIGYCEEKNEMILVYEYMANGTLRSHLYGSNLPDISWKQRIEACIGAARGLHYLHTGAERGIIHRDVKTSNILLDENFVAKMSDFGLSKAGPTLEHTHVSTAVKGSFGYLDPEYFRRQQLTQKSDVYSFGVVLFEVVCARPVINPTLPKDQINLAEWAVRWQRQRSLESIMDPRLEGDCSFESLKKVGEIAEKCLADEGRNRPTIGEVLWHLEYALQLHEAYTKSGDRDSFADLSFSLSFAKEGEGEDCARNFEEDAVRAEFSQQARPQGR